MSDPVLMEFSWEAIGAEANADLAALQRDLESREPTRESPLVHVVGPPRSGTTLAMQTLASLTDIGFIDNVAAAFWRAPTVGILLSRNLRRGEPYRSSWKSEHGRTSGPFEPHEFGRFWRERLHYRSMRQGDCGPDVDWLGLRRTLMSMAAALERPLMLKTVLGIWHLEDLAAIAPTLFVRVRRELEQTALSLLRWREAIDPTRAQWVSLRPRMPSWTPLGDPIQEVAAQAYFIDKQLTQALTRIAGATVLEVNYHTLCSRPQEPADALAAALEPWAVPLLRVKAGDVIDTRDSHRIDGEEYANISRALERLAALDDHQGEP